MPVAFSPRLALGPARWARNGEKMPEMAKERPPRPIPGPDYGANGNRTKGKQVRIYVGNIPLAADKCDFEAFIQETVGKMPDSLLWCTHIESGRFRGFAFMEFDDETAALVAISTLDGLEYEGRVLKVQRAVPRR